jgi:hypothetical protein
MGPTAVRLQGEGCLLVMTEEKAGACSVCGPGAPGDC